MIIRSIEFWRGIGEEKDLNKKRVGYHLQVLEKPSTGFGEEISTTSAEVAHQSISKNGLRSDFGESLERLGEGWATACKNTVAMQGRVRLTVLIGIEPSNEPKRTELEDV